MFVHSVSLLYIQPHFCTFSLTSVQSASFLYIQPHSCTFSLTSVNSVSLLWNEPHFCTVSLNCMGRDRQTQTHKHPDIATPRPNWPSGSIWWKYYMQNNFRNIFIGLSNMDHLWDLKRRVRSLHFLNLTPQFLLQFCLSYICFFV